MIEKWKNAKDVLKIIKSNGFEAYFVGGCVRDELLKRPLKDIDIATSALPEEIASIFTQVIPVGIEHGTVIVRHKQTSYEITTFRHEGKYSDKRHPDQVTFIRDIRGDLARRDFTINALAMDEKGTLIDLYGGKSDLNNKLIRTVGDPKERFTEDALRILRAIRFTSQLGFTIEKDTLEQMAILRHEVKYVAVERIREECTKFFQGEYIEMGMELLCKTKLDSVLPIFSDYPDLIKKTPNKLIPFFTFAEVIALYHFLNREITLSTWINAWKCSKQQRHVAHQLVDALIHYEKVGFDAWLVYQLRAEQTNSFVHLHSLLFPENPISIMEVNQMRTSLPISSRGEINIDGSEIAEIFPIPKGAWIGRLLEQLEYAIVMGNIKNNKIKLKEWILCHPPDKN